MIDCVAIDTETTGLNWAQNDRPFGVGMAWADGSKYYNWKVNPFTRIPEPPKAEQLEALWKVYTDPKVTKVFANAKFDIHMLEQTFGIAPVGPIVDVLVAAWCCNTQEQSYGLKHLAHKYLSISKYDETELREAVREGRALGKSLGFAIASGSGDKIAQDYWLPKTLDTKNDLCKKYCVLDCIRTLELWYYFKDGMEILGTRDTFDKEMELTSVLYDMERKGVRFDQNKCDNEKASLERAISREKDFINEGTGKNINLASSKQLIDLLYKGENSWTIPVTETTKTGAPSTSTITLENFSEENEIVNSILKHKGFSTGLKFCNNYKSLAVQDQSVTTKDLVDLHEKKSIHPGFNQIATCTGRLSCSNPNLQNVSDPEKSNGLFVTDARAMFGPRPGYVWFCIDYKQLEARVFAEIAQEEEMIATFNNPDIDPFTELGTQVYGTRFSPGKRRKITKNVFYCKIFCGGPKVLSKKYHVSPISFAKAILDSLGERFPGIRISQKQIENNSRESDNITTLFGRKIDVDPNFRYRAVSYMVQGSAADLVKRALIRCNDFLKTAKNKIDGHLLLQVHDELVFEIKKEHCYPWVIKHLQYLMEDNKDILKINTPTEVEYTTTNWSSRAKQVLKL